MKLQEENNPFGIYRLEKGEYFEGVCAARGLPALAVARLNGFTRPPEEGQMIAFPPEGYVSVCVLAGDTPASVCKKYGMEEAAFVRLNGESLYPGQYVLVGREK